MDLHVKCDRCGKYAPTAPETSGLYGHPPNPPATWHKLVAFGFPVRINEFYPEGPVSYLLCGDCLPVVKGVIDTVVKQGAR